MLHDPARSLRGKLDTQTSSANMARRDHLIVLTFVFFALLAAHQDDTYFLVETAHLMFEFRWKSLATPLGVTLFMALSDFTDTLGEDNWGSSYSRNVPSLIS